MMPFSSAPSDFSVRPISCAPNGRSGEVVLMSGSLELVGWCCQRYPKPLVLSTNLLGLGHGYGTTGGLRSARGGPDAAQLASGAGRPPGARPRNGGACAHRHRAPAFRSARLTG